MSYFGNDAQSIRRTQLKNDRLFRSRALFSLLFIVICFAILWGQLFTLQIVEHEKYQTLSDQNRIKLMPLPPTRGQIFDRNGKVLATNIPSYDLEVVKQDIPPREQIETLVEKVEKIIPLTQQEKERFYRAFQRAQIQEATPLKEELTDVEIAKIAVNLHHLNGIHITPKLTRFYPYRAHAVHALGYVGRIDERDLKEIADNHLEKEYTGISHIGKRGAEKSFEHLLRGKVGYEQVETSSNGRIVRKISETPPLPGNNIYLTIDIDLQILAEEAMEDYNGALVAQDPRTGEILAFVSKPIYDPNLFVSGISQKDFDALNYDINTPFLNRVMQGRYPPGSVIKPQIALAGLNSGEITPSSTIMCGGHYQVEGDSHRFRDHGAHGRLNIYGAMERSCNVYFYDLAYNLGITPMIEFLKDFSLGTPTQIDLLGESSGVAPTPEYKRSRHNTPWYAGDTVTAGIGQSYWLTTPLQINQATAIIAMAGKNYTPHILRSFARPNSETQYTIPLRPIKPIHLKNEEHWQVIQESMERVVHGSRGTARSLNRNLDYRLAGKTGTAQVKSIAQGERYNQDELDRRHHDHAWFSAYAPAENPQIVVTALVENGGSAARTSGPMVRTVIDAWLSQSYKEEVRSPDNKDSSPP